MSKEGEGLTTPIDRHSLAIEKGVDGGHTFWDVYEDGVHIHTVDSGRFICLVIAPDDVLRVYAFLGRVAGYPNVMKR